MNTPLPPIRPASAAPNALPGWPLLRLGFRPFYLGAALLAALSVPLWLALFLGQLPLKPAPSALLWHAHEMLLGFATAVIVGFLLTAGKAWTGLPTPRGAPLGALVALWLAARIAALAAPHAVYALLDLLFLPIVAGIFLSLLLRANNRRNLPLAGMLSLLSVSNLAFHLGALGFIALSPLAALHSGLALIVMIECVMAGRVVPAFTLSATPGLQLQISPRLERLTLPVTGLGLALWVLAPPGWFTLLALAGAAGLHLRRQWQWQPWVTRDRPILWILHAAYAWIPLGLGLLALAQIGLVPVSAGLHALAVGATGGLIIGMITRTARGHTGRPLKVSGAEVAAYALVMLAAALRVFLPLLAPDLLVIALLGAGAAWTLAFTLYLGLYTPWLMRTRLDGKDG
jgi:uncharacterized protein involved in response to NO